MAVHLQHGKAWYEWIPGWMPICTAILGGAIWVGRYTQGVNDHLEHLDERMTHVERYMEAGVIHPRIPMDGELTRAER